MRRITSLQRPVNYAVCNALGCRGQNSQTKGFAGHPAGNPKGRTTYQILLPPARGSFSTSTFRCFLMHSLVRPFHFLHHFTVPSLMTTWLPPTAADADLQFSTWA